MAKLQGMLSIYSVLALLVIGGYMTFIQAKTFKAVDHLEREAKFSSVMGMIYIGLGIANAIVLML